MGASQSIQKANFEDVQSIFKNPNFYLLINTLSEDEQKCLIKGTLKCNEEELIINKYIRSNKKINIVIYGKNCNDETMIKKYNQIISLGFLNVFIYFGSLFEWLLLQDIYGFENFPTTSKELDLLKYKPRKILHGYLLENNNYM